MDSSASQIRSPSQLRGRRTRQRTKRACETCKVRKRKCDGKDPCGFCLRYEYDCAYSANPRKRFTHPETTISSSPHVPRLSVPQVKSDALNQEHMEANSGMTFPQVLAMKFNPGGAPKVHGFSWNLGLREEPTQPYTNITRLITQHDMEALANVYFEQVHPLYAFLDPDMFRNKVVTRWQALDAADSYDPVLCGVAALGSLYSRNGGHEREPELVQTAKEILEMASTMRKPLLHHATAWLLRTIYLRSTNSPHSSWMASCITMHIMEATGTHQDLVSLVYSDTADISVNEESQRRLFWVATVLNAWISNEYGRSRVVLRGVSCKPPSPREGDFTADLVQLYRISELLDPDQSNEASDLEDSLTRVESFKFSHDPLILSQSNLALTIYRRLRHAMSNISSEVVDRIIRLGNLGLEAAVRMAEARCPWWHVANVPFQFICILLAIDTRESLSHVGHAMRSFKIIPQYFNTYTIYKAVETAESLIRLSQMKKERDLDLLRDGLQDQGIELTEPADLTLTNQSFNDDPALAFLGDPTTQGSLDWDWDAFLNAEIPVMDDVWQRNRR
ncbi:hypothetical protein MAP00_001307 [Monascus purpureus]|nr:hypothetical protein MAP00_001307 [Monascus purpureus]